jgi:hypothetical protein
MPRIPCAAGDGAGQERFLSATTPRRLHHIRQGAMRRPKERAAPSAWKSAARYLVCRDDFAGQADWIADSSHWLAVPRTGRAKVHTSVSSVGSVRLPSTTRPVALSIVASIRV